MGRYLRMYMSNCVEIKRCQVFLPAGYQNFKFQILNHYSSVATAGLARQSVFKLKYS